MHTEDVPQFSMGRLFQFDSYISLHFLVLFGQLYTSYFRVKIRAFKIGWDVTAWYVWICYNVILFIIQKTRKMSSYCAHRVRPLIYYEDNLILVLIIIFITKSLDFCLSRKFFLFIRSVAKVLSFFSECL